MSGSGGFPPTGIIVPRIPPPAKGIKFLDIFVREVAYEGDEVVVKVTSGGKALERSLVRLVSLDTLRVQRKATTNRKGKTSFLAPRVRRPSVFMVQAEKKGYAYYWPKGDWRTKFEGTGFYPIALVTVFPEISGNAPKRPDEVDIL